MNKERVLEVTKDVVTQIKNLIGIEAKLDFKVEDGDEGMVLIYVTFDGEDLGYMIGNHGAHLQAFQFIVSNIVKTKMRKELNLEDVNLAVLVDVGGYREQRAEKIEKLALQKADDARILGEPIDLLPMSASDRRVVHSVLGKFDDLKTESFGEGRDRFVRITPLKEEEIGVNLQVNEDNSTEE